MAPCELVSYHANHHWVESPLALTESMVMQQGSAETPQGSSSGSVVVDMSGQCHAVDEPSQPWAFLHQVESTSAPLPPLTLAAASAALPPARPPLVPLPFLTLPPLSPPLKPPLTPHSFTLPPSRAPLAQPLSLTRHPPPSSAAPPARSLRGTVRRLLQRCQLSDDVALQALEGRLQLLDAHRALSRVRCQQFVTVFEGPHRGTALEASQGATAAESTHSVRCQQFVTAFEGPHRVAAFEGSQRVTAFEGAHRELTSESWGDDAAAAAADGADGAVMGAVPVALEVRDPGAGGRTEADFADEDSSDGDSTGAGQCTPHALSLPTLALPPSLLCVVVARGL
ncbi:unnamed protein product [Closterium sp. Naga37s-1]|nr:unnamed protein product [Closterium sp. Naga37s-1]